MPSKGFKIATKLCEVCGNPLLLTNTRDLDRKRFCSRECNGKASNLSIFKTGVLKSKACKCKRCNIDFITLYSKQKYCGIECQRQDSYQRSYINKEHDIVSFLKKLKRKSEVGRDIDLGFLLNLYDKQNGLCCISNTPMTWILNKGKVSTNISIDQITPGAGYTENNIQLVCYIVNIMKHNQTKEELVYWSNKIMEANHS